MTEPRTTRLLTPADLNVLRRIPLFSFLKPEELDRLAQRFDARHFNEGSVVFHQEDDSGALLIVLRGRIKTQLISRDGRRLTLTFVSPGSYFGPLALLDDRRRAVDAVADEPSELLVLKNEDFRRYLLQYPAAALVLLDRYLGLTRANMQRLHDHVFLDGRTRLAKALLAHAVQNGTSGVVVQLTQAELASITGTTPESISRWLKEFSLAGLISAGRGRVRILDSRGLSADLE